MRCETRRMMNEQGLPVFTYQWLPDEEKPHIKAAVQIAHGMCETAERYTDLVSLLTSRGYAVYANDHRGHGHTAECPEYLGDVGDNGFEGMVQDLLQLRERIRGNHPGIPLVLLGHSMGSFLTQWIMYTYGERYDAYILSGTNGPQSLLPLGEKLAALQIKLQGPLHRSLLLNAIVFGPYNKGFGPIRTPFDWLSSDPDEVDKYIQDPYCGQVCTARFFRDFFHFLRGLHKPVLMRNIDVEKPVYLFSGEEDPVGGRGKGIRRLIQLYHNLGIKDLEYRLYPGGRHEMLHEVNREQVAADVLEWLQRHFP